VLSISSRKYSLRVAALALALLALAGCSSSKPLTYQEHAAELSGVPFFAQERYQCGPAALATVLVYSDVDTTPEQLVPLVYVPGRKGSFQAELKAATRSAARLPYELDGSLDALLDEVSAGNPVLILQNLGLSWLPKWHYAVVMGYDPVSDSILLRSGTEARRKESTNRFLYSWQLADNWAMVVLRPGQLPATATAEAYVSMLAASEGRLDSASMEAALETGLRTWPTNPDLLFAAGNHARLNNDVQTAADRYRAALMHEPQHVGARNNYADLLREESCFASALQEIIAARRAVAPDSPIYPVIDATAREIKAAGKASKLRDTGPLCQALTAGDKSQMGSSRDDQ
jgi:tetratricopeptide (TPR) repeat protein